MNCPNCRSEILEGWHFCPKCGRPSPSAARLTSGPTAPPPSMSRWELLESLGFGLLFITPRRRIGQMNRVARTIFGIREDRDPIGKPFEEFVHHPKLVAIIQRCLTEDSRITTIEDGENREQPCEFTVHEGTVDECIYQVRSSHSYDSTYQLCGTAFVFQDITTLRNVARWKVEIFCGLSHDLHSFLIPIKGFTQTMLADANEDLYSIEDRREFNTVIDEYADGLRGLIVNLVECFRIDRMGQAGFEFNWDNVSLQRVTEEVLAKQRVRTDKHKFVIDFEPEEILFVSDADKIGFLLNHFIANAIDYSWDGGEIRIIARLKPADDEFLTDSVLIGVKDQRATIDPQSLNLLNHPNGERLKDPRHAGRNGIALYLIKNMIAAHQGTMKVESELGKGSTFWARLPLRQGSREELAEE